MKILLLATALMGLAGIIPAAAAVVCTTSSNSTTCYDYDSNSYATCTQSGNTTVCN